MKVIKLLILCLFAIMLTGCAYDRGLILFNNSPITQYNALHDQKIFLEGSRIYYLFIAPHKLKTDYIRVQVFTMTDKGNLGGYEVVRTKDVRLMKDERYYYTDYFTFWEKGKYGMQVFSHDDFTNPLAVNYFFIK